VLFRSRAFHLLAHQLICLSLQNNGIYPNSAWIILSKAHCFSNIKPEEFKELTNFMIEQKYFRDVDGLLIVGEETEKNFLSSNWRRLFAVFESGPMYNVWDEKKHVGTLDSAFVEALEIPFLFVLGGIEWEAYKIKAESRDLFAKKTKAGEAPKWVTFSGFDVPIETAKEAGRILFSSETPNYLNQEAQESITSTQNKFKKILWSEDRWVISFSSDVGAEIWTFAGDRINRTLSKLITHSGIANSTSSYQKITLKKVRDNKLTLKERILILLNDIKTTDVNTIHNLENKLFDEIRLSLFSKFARCLPESLWYKALAERIFDFEGLVKELNTKRIEII